MDLYDRKIIGRSISTRLYTKETILTAWRMASRNRSITRKLIFHSDIRIQYACLPFQRLLKANPLITQSMSRKANCWDNAVAESFFKTLKAKLIYPSKFDTIEQAKSA